MIAGLNLMTRPKAQSIASSRGPVYMFSDWDRGAPGRAKLDIRAAWDACNRARCVRAGDRSDRGRTWLLGSCGGTAGMSI